MKKETSTNPVLTTEQAEELIKRIEMYKKQLCDDPKVSATKFDHFQTALYGAKCIIQDMAGIPRKREMAWSK